MIGKEKKIMKREKVNVLCTNVIDVTICLYDL